MKGNKYKKTVKTLWRTAIAHKNLRHFEKATEYLEEALKINPDAEFLKKELARCKDSEVHKEKNRLGKLNGFLNRKDGDDDDEEAKEKAKEDCNKKVNLGPLPVPPDQQKKGFTRKRPGDDHKHTESELSAAEN